VYLCVIGQGYSDDMRSAIQEGADALMKTAVHQLLGEKQTARISGKGTGDGLVDADTAAKNHEAKGVLLLDDEKSQRSGVEGSVA
jgi:hypothetical protein